MGFSSNATPNKAGGPLGYSMTIFLYLALNISLNLTCKYALGSHFAFPITLTLAHMAFSFIALTPVMLLVPAFRQQHKHTLAKQWKGFIAIGAFLAANIALNNISLVYITLTLNQIIRSSIPVITALMAVPVEGRVPSRNEFVALVILSMGVMLSVWEGSVSGSATGILFCVVATVSNAAMMTCSGKIMSEKVDALRLTWYTAPVSCVCLLPLFFLAEAGAMETYWQTHWQDALWIILVTSANALAYNVVHYLTIQITSAVTTTVLGMVKIVGLLVLSGYILQEGKTFTPRLALGCVGTLLGFCMYSHTRLQVAQRNAKQAAARDEEEHGIVGGGLRVEKQPLLGHQGMGGKQDA